ncbi:hypothetical protein JCM3765_006375 [Sporobolomyces pararoseus]
MTRYLIFNDPPSLEQCLESIKNPHHSFIEFGEWVETSFEFQDESTTKPSRAAVAVWDTSGSQFKDATPDFIAQRRKRSSSSSSSSSGEVSLTRNENKKNKKSRISNEGGRGGGGGDESICQSFFMFPPPSQPRQQKQQTLHDTTTTTTTTIPSYLRTRTTKVTPPPQQDLTDDDTTFSRHYNQTSIMMMMNGSSSSPLKEEPDEGESSSFLEEEENNNSSLELSIGPPPHLPWFLHDLTKLDQLRKRLIDHSSSGSSSNGPIVSILSIISNINFKQVGGGENYNNRLCELTLKDETGGKIKLIGWGQQAEELKDFLKIGDVVFFGKVRLMESKFSTSSTSSTSSTCSLELRLIESISKVGISFRTRVSRTEEDELYRFDLVGWSRELEQARAVKEIVDWWVERN